MANQSFIAAMEQKRAEQVRKQRQEAAFRENYDGEIATQGQSESPFGDLVTSGLEWLGVGGKRAYDLGQTGESVAEMATPYGTLESLEKGDLEGAAMAAVGGPGKKLTKLVGGAKEELAKTLAKTKNKGGVKAPAVHTKGEGPLIQRIFEHAEKNRTPKYDMATEPVFEPANTELTKALVPQQSIADKIPQLPDRNAPLPANDRSRGIYEHADEIGERLAADLRSSDSDPLPFYSTGSVLQGLEDKAGLRPSESRELMRDWAGQGAATSPRTKTPPNLRNAQFLMFERARGDPLTPERQLREQSEGLWGFNKKGAPNLNRPGFPMMEMHTKLGDEFANDTVDMLKNPKPSTFRENWTGNMADVTADTHNIRKVLDVYDQMAPGTLPREWFKNDAAYKRYVDNGGFPKEGELPVGDIEDGLAGSTVNKRYSQTEYPVIQRPTQKAAEILGISPAEAQERLWFQGGPRTGLKSPEMTIPDLFNAQIEETAKATGLTPDAIMRLWARRKIPFAANEPDTEMPGASASA